MYLYLRLKALLHQGNDDPAENQLFAGFFIVRFQLSAQVHSQIPSAVALLRWQTAAVIRGMTAFLPMFSYSAMRLH